MLASEAAVADVTPAGGTEEPLAFGARMAVGCQLVKRRGRNELRRDTSGQLCMENGECAMRVSANMTVAEMDWQRKG